MLLESLVAETFVEVLAAHVGLLAYQLSALFHRRRRCVPDPTPGLDKVRSAESWRRSCRALDREISC